MLFGISLTFSLLFDTSINSLHSKIKNPSEQGQPLLYAHTLHITMQSSDFHQSGSLRDPIDNSCVRSSPRRSAPSACHIFIQGEEKLLFRQLLFPNSYLCIRFTNQTLTVITAFSTSPQEKGGIASLCMHVQTRPCCNMTTSVEVGGMTKTPIQILQLCVKTQFFTMDQSFKRPY